jgi:hypothetical protein
MRKFIFLPQWQLWGKKISSNMRDLQYLQIYLYIRNVKTFIYFCRCGETYLANKMTFCIGGKTYPNPYIFCTSLFLTFTKGKMKKFRQILKDFKNHGLQVYMFFHVWTYVAFCKGGKPQLCAQYQWQWKLSTIRNVWGKECAGMVVCSCLARYVIIHLKGNQHQFLANKKLSLEGGGRGFIFCVFQVH